MSDRTENPWMAFAYVPMDEAMPRNEVLQRRAAAGASTSRHATRESAERAAREKLRELRKADASIPWVVCYALPASDGRGHTSDTGCCYRIKGD